MDHIFNRRICYCGNNKYQSHISENIRYFSKHIEVNTKYIYKKVV